MATELVSKQTRNAFREAIPRIWDLNGIDEVFRIEDVPFNDSFVPPCNVSHVRKIRVECYYSSMDFTDKNDVEKLLRIYEIAIRDIGNPKRLLQYLKRDGYFLLYGRLSPLQELSLPLEWSMGMASEFDLPVLERQISQISEFIESDPDLAIGRALAVLETICKTILKERGVNFENNDDFTKLFKTVQRNLKLMPEDIEDFIKGSKYIRRLLGNLAGISRGMNEVRNLYGGHGREGRSTSLKSRHAKLAAGAATTLAVFLYETHLETKERTP